MAGTDTSITAYEEIKYKPHIKALTVACKQGKPRHTERVKKMVAFLKLDPEFQVFDQDEMVNAAEKVVDILKTFDPTEVRNSTFVPIGLAVVKEKGLKSVLTSERLGRALLIPLAFRFI